MSLALDNNRLVIDASWEEYEKFLEAVGNRRIRVTFDRGQLELMAPLPSHERPKKLLATLLEALLVDLGLDFEALGSSTFRRRDLDRGLEPDECYWIKHALDVRGLERLDFEVHPPPDLVLEVEVTHSVLDRLGIYHALKVPEVWRYTREGELQALHWSSSGYLEARSSLAFPGLPVHEVASLLKGDSPRPQLVRDFLSWARRVTLS